uniref:WW domain containing adaptor with coiled-coil n=1 Tax=Homo sapiens TaxID=9606 RepID=A0A7P0TBE3_HUMAN
MRDAGDPSPPNKMLRRSDSPENKYSDSTGHSKAKNVHTHRVRERDGGEVIPRTFCCLFIQQTWGIYCVPTFV